MHPTVPAQTSTRASSQQQGVLACRPRLVLSLSRLHRPQTNKAERLHRPQSSTPPPPSSKVQPDCVGHMRAAKAFAAPNPTQPTGRKTPTIHETIHAAIKIAPPPPPPKPHTVHPRSTQKLSSPLSPCSHLLHCQAHMNKQPGKPQ